MERAETTLYFLFDLTQMLESKCCFHVFLGGAPAPPVLVKAEATPPIKDSPVRKAVPSQFPLLERVKGKTSEQLTALEESFQRSSSPADADLGKTLNPVKNMLI